MIDRELADRLADDETRAQDREPTMDDAIDAVPAFDEGALPDPFAQLPKGLS